MEANAVKNITKVTNEHIYILLHIYAGEYLWVVCLINSNVIGLERLGGVFFPVYEGLIRILWSNSSKIKITFTTFRKYIFGNILKNECSLNTITTFFGNCSTPYLIKRIMSILLWSHTSVRVYYIRLWCKCICWWEEYNCFMNSSF